MKTIRHPIALVLAALAFAVLLAACSNDSKPAVCTDVDNIQKTVDDLKNVKPEAGALGNIQSELTTLKQQFGILRTDAKSQFQTETTALSASLDSLSSAVDAAKANPSLSTLAPVGTALAGVKDTGQSLVSAVKGTC
ncbi:MAG TPA: hypothetical protein VFJ85_14895 [Acidimicrobiales bacterium]|nr:hypothetical protein [Acidimicrobiales bacterium]